MGPPDRGLIRERGFKTVSLSHNGTKRAYTISQNWPAVPVSGFECETGLFTRCSYKYTTKVHNLFMD